MQYYRCKCGKMEAWGSMPPDQCHGCKECGTNLALDPYSHHPPEPHEFTATVEQWGEHGPVQIPVCRYCHQPKWAIDSEERESDE